MVLSASLWKRSDPLMVFKDLLIIYKLDCRRFPGLLVILHKKRSEILVYNIVIDALLFYKSLSPSDRNIIRMNFKSFIDFVQSLQSDPQTVYGLVGQNV